MIYRSSMALSVVTGQSQTSLIPGRYSSLSFAISMAEIVTGIQPDRMISTT